MRKLLATLLLAGAGLGFTGCYADVGYAYHPVACHAVWIPGHYSYWGRWHPGYWRCA
jgi:hypothetical protein